MTRCIRCHDETHGRRKIALRDFTDRRALYQEGRLCNRCWEIVAGELVGLDVGHVDSRGGQA